MKKRIAILLIVCLCILNPLTALAARPANPGPPADVATPLYLNLGDSIAYGMSAAPGQSYFDLYSENLIGPSLNLGVPGAKTSDLLYALQTKEYQRAVQRADIITISIGGNNLLGPVIEAMSNLLGITPEELISIHNDPIALNQAFLTAAQTLGIPPDHPDFMAVLVQTLAETVIFQAQQELLAGAHAFSTEWPAIYSTIRQLNPNATVIVLTIINPFTHAGNDLLIGAFNSFVGSMNDESSMNYLLGLPALMDEKTYVADAYSEFLINSGAVGFSLSPPLNLDIHPTTLGHGIIFNLLTDLGDVRAFQPGKPDAIGKPLSPEIPEKLEVSDVEAAAGMPAAHGVTGAEFGSLVSETVQEDPDILADHVSSKAAGLPEAHGVSGYTFGQAVSGLALENPAALAAHVRDR